MFARLVYHQLSVSPTKIDKQLIANFVFLDKPLFMNCSIACFMANRLRIFDFYQTAIIFNIIGLVIQSYLFP